MKESLKHYFEQEDTPMAGSMIGQLMVKVLEKYPEMNFEQARTKAQELLAVAASKRRYVMPTVLSESELAAKSAAGKAYWASRRLSKAA